MKRNLFKIASILALGVTSTAFAATDGDVGTESTGTAGITLTIPKLVKITGMRDLSIIYTAGMAEANIQDNENVCVYSNLADGDGATSSGSGGESYSVTATGSGDEGAFTLSRTSGGSSAATIAYSVSFNDSADATTTGTGRKGPTPLSAGTRTAGFKGFTNTEACSTDNANYKVSFTENAVLAAYHGTYTGTLTLLVQPD